MGMQTNTEKKMRTPWGPAQTVRKITPSGSILEVTTAGHGGFKLDARTNAKVDPAWRRKGGWYEEDCEYAIVGLTFQQDAGFSCEAVEDCRSVCRNYFPDAYETIYGVKVTAEQSHVVKLREAHEAAKGRLQVCSCWGDWSKNVPAGMVGVCAAVDACSPHPRPVRDMSKDRYFLVTKEEYDAKGTILCVDEGKHVEVFADEKGACPFG